jgi:large subunit ribosomal protein L28
MVKLLSKHVFKEELNMAKKVSNKKPLFGNKRSHALNATKKRQKVNMQKVALNGVTVIMSAKEAKKFRKNNAE